MIVPEPRKIVDSLHMISPNPLWINMLLWILSTLFPCEDLFKMSINMPDPFWHDWEWIFGFPLF